MAIGGIDVGTVVSWNFVSDLPRIEVDENVDCFNSIVMLLGHELRGRRMAGTMVFDVSVAVAVDAKNGDGWWRIATVMAMAMAIGAVAIIDGGGNCCCWRWRWKSLLLLVVVAAAASNNGNSIKLEPLYRFNIYNYH